MWTVIRCPDWLSGATCMMLVPMPDIAVIADLAVLAFMTSVAVHLARQLHQEQQRFAAYRQAQRIVDDAVGDARSGPCLHMAAPPPHLSTVDRFRLHLQHHPVVTAAVAVALLGAASAVLLVPDEVPPEVAGPAPIAPAGPASPADPSAAITTSIPPPPASTTPPPTPPGHSTIPSRHVGYREITRTVTVTTVVAPPATATSSRPDARSEAPCQLPCPLVRLLAAP
jgi:hypothetical protein